MQIPHNQVIILYLKEKFVPRESPIYLEDWIGLRALDEAGKLVFLDTDGNHLIFTDEWFIENIVLPYLN